MPRLDRDYSVYKYFVAELKQEQIQTISDFAGTDDMGRHAGLTETSLIMHLRPDLVDMSTQDPVEGRSLERLADLRAKGVFTGFNWYGEYPYHIAGNPGPASAELGRMIFEMKCKNLAEVIRAVKADDESEKIISEYGPLGEKPV